MEEEEEEEAEEEEEEEEEEVVVVVVVAAVEEEDVKVVVVERWRRSCQTLTIIPPLPLSASYHVQKSRRRAIRRRLRAA
jgi:hypothetical protein